MLEEQGEWWRIAVTADCFTSEEQTATHTQETTGWVEHRYCFINLPDVVPSIIYDATNSYSSHFRLLRQGSSRRSPARPSTPAGPTTSGWSKMEFMMPVLYSMAFTGCAPPSRAALAEGNSLILYEGYRPHCGADQGAQLPVRPGPPPTRR